MTMSSEYARKGSCLCGSVRVEVARDVHKVDACHCGMCRKWGGGPLMAVGCEGGVEFTGEDHISAYGSSDWAERGFCRNCGTHLFYRLKGADHYAIPAGLFDDHADFSFEEQIFIDKKPPYYEFANATHDMTEAEVFEKFAPGT
jgi:hypothetical protein